MFRSRGGGGGGGAMGIRTPLFCWTSCAHRYMACLARIQDFKKGWVHINVTYDNGMLLCSGRPNAKSNTLWVILKEYVFSFQIFFDC